MQHGGEPTPCYASVLIRNRRVFRRRSRAAPIPFLNFAAPLSMQPPPYACAFKPQIAYFSAYRAEAQLEKLIAYIHTQYPGVPVILDAKRGDIGSTAALYA